MSARARRDSALVAAPALAACATVAAARGDRDTPFDLLGRVAVNFERRAPSPRTCAGSTPPGATRSGCSTPLGQTLAHIVERRRRRDADRAPTSRQYRAAQRRSAHAPGARLGAAAFPPHVVGARRSRFPAARPPTRRARRAIAPDALDQDGWRIAFDVLSAGRARRAAAPARSQERRPGDPAS